MFSHFSHSYTPQLSPLRSCLRSALFSRKSTPNSFSPITSRCAASLSTVTISKLSLARQSVHLFDRAYSNAAISSPDGINSNVSLSSTSQVALLKHVPLIRTFANLPYRTGSVLKPTDVILEKDFKYDVQQRQVSNTSPDDPVIEMAFFQAPALDQSLVPRTRTGKDIAAEVEAMGIEIDEFKKYWFDDGKSAEQFWSMRFLKHYRFSNSECISNYVALIWKFANEYLIDNDKRDSLGTYLAKRGFETGKYHNSNEFIKHWTSIWVLKLV
ncbi:hypothetical protein POM88_048433 [Heracleum sosnowskyi]|uniref:Uncharacterized protein n=1 Tax=Heracleum sosnowskyi TaxID=360622 RepID=A0AAD8GTU4_9APIA|nr:hypothetical protein POM88_048433 [Heracleum sosnowskyi]